MGLQENKAASLRFWNEVLNGRDLSVLDDIMAPDVVDHGAFPGQAPGIEGIRDMMGRFLAGFSDLHYDIEDLIGEGDLVVSRFTAAGTFDGEFFGLAATGQTVTGSGISIDRYENGRIVECWMSHDTLGFAQQLGLVPVPDAAVS